WGIHSHCRWRGVSFDAPSKDASHDSSIAIRSESFLTAFSRISTSTLENCSLGLAVIRSSMYSISDWSSIVRPPCWAILIPSFVGILVLLSASYGHSFIGWPKFFRLDLHFLEAPGLSQAEACATPWGAR